MRARRKQVGLVAIGDLHRPGPDRLADTVRIVHHLTSIGSAGAATPAVRSAVLDHGQTYRGTASILDHTSLTIYEPIRDTAG